MIIATCDQCGYSGKLASFPVNNEQHTCPRCKTDESGLSGFFEEDVVVNKVCETCNNTVYMNADTQEWEHHHPSFRHKVVLKDDA